jgi:AraC family transcriptional regulator of adaptative response / DNA-3-methyladenine glycosylase II
MTLSWQVCSRARLSRDARFDGKFFIAVLTSRVYCRPICPARTAKEQNVRYYSTAAAAAEAGFRPCLRCRPECSPGTPAWLGTPTTVARALRIISESGLEDGGVETLAARLGIGSRHLRRLFLRHLGATPSAVARTRRLHFAKKLIDETKLPMSEIALASGYGCVRRFNADIQKVYRRTPTQIRNIAPKSSPRPDDQYFFRLRYRPPYHWEGLLAFLAPRATPGIEVVEQGNYRRSIWMHEASGYFEASLDPSTDSVDVRVQFPNPRSLYFIIERVRAMFDLNADCLAISRSLNADPELSRRLRSMPGLRVPGCWDGFELAVRAILGQQITVKGATNLAGRLVQAYGDPWQTSGGGITHLFPTPERLAKADVASVGMPRARAETIRALARSVADGKIVFDGSVPPEVLLEQLCELPGIGAWTAQYVAMRALGEPDAFPSSDLGLLRALDLNNSRELELRAENWRPWRAYAAMYLWSTPSRISKDVAAGREVEIASQSFAGRV